MDNLNINELEFLISMWQLVFIYNQYEQILELYGIEKRKEFVNQHSSFIALLRTVFHMSIIAARKIHEEKIREGLSNSKWKKLINARNYLSHAFNDDSKYTFIEIFDILVELYNHILLKYDLINNNEWKRLAEAYKKNVLTWSDLFKVDIQ